MAILRPPGGGKRRSPLARPSTIDCLSDGLLAEIFMCLLTLQER